jgi:predicted AlkP superfamily pyrophosphatase or phosphodiesterase
VKTRRVFIALLLATSACATGGGPRVHGATTSAPVALPAPAVLAQPARVLLVSIHGLSPDRYLAADGAIAMPMLAALAQQGVAAESMRPVFPSASYPAHATLVTGVPVAKHGIAAAGLDQASDLRAVPLWQAVAQQGRTVASLDWPTTGGAAIADLAPDLAVAAGATWLDALASSGAGRAAEFARRAGGGDPATAAPGAARDATLVTMACALFLAEPAPALVLLRLSQTQVALDAAGPDSEPAHAAFAASDAELGRLVRCLGDAGLLDTTGIAVAGDHGAMPVHTEIRANVALADAGLLVPSGSGARSFDAITRSNGGSAFVYATSDDAALLARRALDAAANESGVFRVMSASEMVERGADPEAWFGLEADPGYLFADAAKGTLLAPASVASAGGYAASDPHMATGFVAWGPGLRRGLRVPELRQSDVAPALARWLGVSFGPVEGRSMVGWFAPGNVPAIRVEQAEPAVRVPRRK